MTSRASCEAARQPRSVLESARPPACTPPDVVHNLSHRLPSPPHPPLTPHLVVPPLSRTLRLNAPNAILTKWSTLTSMCAADTPVRRCEYIFLELWLIFIYILIQWCSLSSYSSALLRYVLYHIQPAVDINLLWRAARNLCLAHKSIQLAP